MIKIIKINPYLIKESQKFLPQDYIKSLQNKQDFNESIVARYSIFLENKFLPKIDSNWKPIFENKKYWNISHKKDIVFVWTSKFPIWVDIEIIKPRSSEVFSLHKENEYKLFWEKNINTFYQLWTIKESVIKLHLAWIDDLEHIKINKIEIKETIIDWVIFNFKIYWKFQNKDFVSYNWVLNELIYGMSYFS